jgi:pyruvate dehydrogenase E2 component (dihydrolipoamide acetyltransferase)
MATEVVMPKMGYDMTEGTVLSWTKAPGDPVAKGEVLGEIETGKVNIEIEAFEEGIFGAALVPEGTTVPVGTPIAVIVAPGEAVPEPAAAPAPTSPPAEAPAPQAAPAADTDQATKSAAASERTSATKLAPATPMPSTEAGVAQAVDGRVKASPLARRLAGEHGLDLRAVAGSGPGGRVLRDDVLAAVEERPVTVPAPDRAAAPAAPVAAPAEAAPPAPAAEPERVPLSRMRSTIARRLGESWTAAPHIFLTMAIDMGEALALREQVNSALAAAEAGKVSVNDLVVKAVARALRREPRLNVSYDEGHRLQHPRVNVGVAVALEDGLITLTVADADVKGLAAIGAELAAKSARARAGQLTAEDLALPSTFTVSNLGMYGIEDFTAILNPPEAGILAVGAALPTPVARDEAVVVRPIMKVTLSADHRVVDGATAAQFLVHLRELLEQPLLLLV